MEKIPDNELPTQKFIKGSNAIEVSGPCPKCGTQLTSKDEMIRHFHILHRDIPQRPYTIGEKV